MGSALSQGELELVRFDTSALLAEIRAALFPEITSRITCLYGSIPTVANITKLRPERHVISLHTLLNHAGTPELVIRHILIHELLHIEIPPRELRAEEIDPRLPLKRSRKPQEPLGPLSHPPEFWERERLLSPERDVVMEWIHDAFGIWLKRDERTDGLWIRPGWKKCGKGIRRATLEEIRELVGLTLL